MYLKSEWASDCWSTTPEKKYLGVVYYTDYVKNFIHVKHVLDEIFGLFACDNYVIAKELRCEESFLSKFMYDN